MADSPDELLEKLKDTDLRRVGLVLNKSIPANISLKYNSSDLIKIEKIKNSSSHLTYQFESLSDQLIVFSEIYYPSGWEVYVDGVESSYFDIDYLLRGMLVPKGEHTIEFYFSPKIVKTGINIRIITIIITFSLIAFLIYKENKWA